MEQMNKSRLSLVVHSVFAVLAGWLAVYIGNNLYGGVVGIVVLIAVGFGVEKAVKEKGFKWWLANGLIVYLFLWLVSWAYFFNLAM